MCSYHTLCFIYIIPLVKVYISGPNNSAILSSSPSPAAQCPAWATATAKATLAVARAALDNAVCKNPFGGMGPVLPPNPFSALITKCHALNDMTSKWRRLQSDDTGAYTSRTWFALGSE